MLSGLTEKLSGASIASSRAQNRQSGDQKGNVVLPRDSTSSDEASRNPELIQSLPDDVLRILYSKLQPDDIARRSLFATSHELRNREIVRTFAFPQIAELISKNATLDRAAKSKYFSFYAAQLFELPRELQIEAASFLTSSAAHDFPQSTRFILNKIAQRLTTPTPNESITMFVSNILATQNLSVPARKTHLIQQIRALHDRYKDSKWDAEIEIKYDHDPKKDRIVNERSYLTMHALSMIEALDLQDRSEVLSASFTLLQHIGDDDYQKVFSAVIKALTQCPIEHVLASCNEATRFLSRYLLLSKDTLETTQGFIDFLACTYRGTSAPPVERIFFHTQAIKSDETFCKSISSAAAYISRLKRSELRTSLLIETFKAIDRRPFPNDYNLRYTIATLIHELPFHVQLKVKRQFAQRLPILTRDGRSRTEVMLSSRLEGLSNIEAQRTFDEAVHNWKIQQCSIYNSKWPPFLPE